MKGEIIGRDIPVEKILIELILRKIEVRDIEEIYKNIHLKYVQKYFPLEEEKQWEEHKKWYTFIINSPTFLFYTIENLKKEFLGTVKFELEENGAIISIYLVEKIRGKHFSDRILKLSIEELRFEKPEIDRIIAYILEENLISQKVFLNNGFKYIKKKKYNGVKHLMYEKNFEF